MLRYIDENGRDATAKRRTVDGHVYPMTMVAVWKLRPVKFSLDPAPVTVLDVPMVAIHCGPDAPYPSVPTPEQILNGALGI